MKFIIFVGPSGLVVSLRLPYDRRSGGYLERGEFALYDKPANDIPEQ